MITLNHTVCIISLFMSCYLLIVCLNVRARVSDCDRKGCAEAGPKVRWTLENRQDQSHISNPPSHPASLTLRCHGISRRVTVSLATEARSGCCIVCSDAAEAERCAEGGEGGEHKSESAVIKQAQVSGRAFNRYSTLFFFFPSSSFSNQHWLKQQHQPDELPFAYMRLVKSELMPKCELPLTRPY